MFQLNPGFYSNQMMLGMIGDALSCAAVGVGWGRRDGERTEKRREGNLMHAIVYSENKRVTSK